MSNARPPPDHQALTDAEHAGLPLLIPAVARYAFVQRRAAHTVSLLHAPQPVPAGDRA